MLLLSADRKQIDGKEGMLVLGKSRPMDGSECTIRKRHSRQGRELGGSVAVRGPADCASRPGSAAVLFRDFCMEND